MTRLCSWLQSEAARTGEEDFQNPSGIGQECRRRIHTIRAVDEHSVFKVLYVEFMRSTDLSAACIASVVIN